MVLLRFLLCTYLCLCLVANTAGYDPLDWTLEPIGDIIVQGFSDAIVFRYSTPVLFEGNECSVSVFEEDCITDGGSAVYLDMVNITSVERELSSHFRIDTDTIRSSSYYTDLDSYRGRIAFCTRVDCALNGESYNFHETQLLAVFDWTLDFVVDAELGGFWEKEKEKEMEYTIAVYPTDGDLDDESLEVLTTVIDDFLVAELNTVFSPNTVEVTTTIVNQTMITTEVVEEGLRLLRARYGSRSLTENVTGSEVEFDCNITFASEPAPTDDEVNAAVEDALHENPDLCDGSNSTELENVTVVPEIQEGSRNQIFGSFSLGYPLNAFFCDASSNLVADPVISQGDTIQVCVRLSQNSSYFHLENIYTMALTQPTTGVRAHYPVYNGNASALATSNCQLGLCNILSQVPSRFFNDQDPGPLRIVGVALLNVGSTDRRFLAPIEFSGHRQLQTADVPRSAFELVAKIIGSLDQDSAPPTNSSNEDVDIGVDIGSACFLLLSATTFFVVFLFICRRRKQEASRTPCEPLPVPEESTPPTECPERGAAGTLASKSNGCSSRSLA
jgi:hypothetical protein